MFEMLALWLLAGLVAGSLAPVVMKVGSYGPVPDIVLGLVGSVLGGSVVLALGVLPQGGTFAMSVVALVGAACLLAAQRLLYSPPPSRPRPRRSAAPGAWSRP